MEVRTIASDRRTALVAILVLFIVWAGISSYWYVCNIKKLCTVRSSPAVSLVATSEITTETPIQPVKLSAVPYTGIDEEPTCAPYITHELGGAGLSSGEDVVRLERFLGISEDTMYGAADYSAVAAFQLQNDLSMTGTVDGKTLLAINRLMCTKK